MKIALHCSRLNHLKLLAPVVAEAQRRGHAVVYWYLKPPLVGDKEDAWREGERVQREGGAAAHWFDGGPATADVLVSVSLRVPTMMRGRWRHLALGYHEEELLDVNDGAWSPGFQIATWTEAHADWLHDMGVSTKDIHVVGFPELDQLAGMNRAACRKKHNLPQTRRILLFMPAARAALLRPRWAFRWFWYAPCEWPRGPQGWPQADRVPSYKHIVTGVRAYADRNQAMLIMKTRTKHRDPWFVRSFADRIIGDESFSPFTTLEFMVAADFVVGLAGGWAVEAAAAGRPYLSLLAYPQKAYEHPRLLDIRASIYHTLWPHLFRLYQEDEWRQFQDWVDEDGCWPPHMDSGMPMPDGKASARVLDVLETMC